MIFTQEFLRCPVGKEVIGERFKNEAAALHCADCDFIFIWEPNNSIPKSKKVDHVDRRCGCGCGR